MVMQAYSRNFGSGTQLKVTTPSGVTSYSYGVATARYSDLSNIISRRQRKPFVNPQTQMYKTLVYNTYAPVRGNTNSGTVTEISGPSGNEYPGSTASTAISHSSQADRKAISKLYDQLRGSELDLAIDLAELSKTNDMLQKAMSRVVDFANLARKGALKRFLKRKLNKRTPRRWDRDFSNAWLEYTYGWKPLVSTIHGIAEFDTTKAKRFRVKGRGSHKEINFLRRSVFYPNCYANEKREDNTRCQYQFDLQVSNQTLLDAGRLSSLNPAGIIWELVPFSFVCDWFIDIGGFIKNVETSFLSGTTVIRGFKTQVTVRTIEGVTGGGGRITATYSTRCDVFTANYREVLKERQPQFALPLPYAPQWAPHLGWQRLVSGAALLRQIAKFPFGKR